MPNNPHRSARTAALATAQDPAFLPTAAVEYRLYVGDQAPDTVAVLVALVSRYVEGATCLYGEGLWHGASEPCVCISVVAPASAWQDILYLAGDIKVVCGQTAILVTRTPCSQWLV